jgi:CheY-like chemotaxis protein
MEPMAIARAAGEAGREPQPALLLADDEPGLRTLFAVRATHAVEGLSVLEAEDGAQAVQIGLQQQPGVALLDVQMPRLGGIEAAIALRELHPQIRLAVCTSDPAAHRDRAREQRLLLFDKIDLDRPIRWLELQVRALHATRRPRPQRLNLECVVCGYGAARPEPPERCPMCQSEGSWQQTPWLPFSCDRVLTGWRLRADHSMQSPLTDSNR